MALSKNQLKFIKSLSQKKYRQKHGVFIAEGIKVVGELLHSNLELTALFATELLNFSIPDHLVTFISEAELKKISNLKTPNKVLAIFKIKNEPIFDEQAFTLVLDGINDPGNLGTIIRLCDWFGIEQVVCSANTVDCYNPKVVQSTMGSLSRVRLYYQELIPFLTKTSLPIFLADMNGKNIYETKMPENAILIMGNEANGISEEILAFNHNTISIPRFGNLQATESLNVATATAILLSEYCRKLP